MVLDQHIKRIDVMDVGGKMLKKSIQNDSTPTLDLLVREVVQNSLDAKKDNVDCVKLEFKNGNLDNNKLIECLGNIGKKIENKYQTFNKSCYMAFRDSNTTGLTGPMNLKDVVDNKFGRLINLVFNIGKPQTAEGAGGSWGYGKTVYYRVGIGLVVYYTRIVENGIYKSRLVITFIEDEENTIIPSGNIDNQSLKSGIMWFGKNVNNSFYPVTNENEIKEILDIFNIPLYTENETGTTVIIPYIDEEKLLDQTFSNDEDNKNYFVWNKTIEEYIKYSIQKWYAPRLMNRYYKDNPYLYFILNGYPFDEYDDFHPFFKMIQNLYNSCIGIENDNVIVENIKIRDSSNIVGKIAYGKFTKYDMEITQQDADPFAEITNIRKNHDVNEPIIAFCRKPGMVLKYDIKEKWSNKIKVLDEDKYLVGFFLANSNAILKDKPNGQESLEEYLRSSEKADHMDWNDEQKCKIVSKLQNKVQSIINDSLKEVVEEEQIEISSPLNKKLARLFLPQKGFGRRPSGIKAQIQEEKRASLSNKINATINDIEGSFYIDEDDNKTKSYTVNFGNKENDMSFELQLVSEDGTISPSRWYKDFERRLFPIKILKIDLLEKHCNNDTEYLNNVRLHEENKKYEDKEYTFEVEKDEFDQIIGFRIFKKETIKYLKFRITYSYNDEGFIGSISKKGNANE